MLNSFKALNCLARLQVVAMAVIFGLGVHPSAAQNTISGVHQTANPTAGASQQLAPNPTGRQTAGSATCTPAGSAICKAFTSGCDAVKGGLSSSPGGGVTCSIAAVKPRQRTLHVNGMIQSARRSGGVAKAEVSTCKSDGTSDGNQICAGFGTGCGNLGCGPSTNPDGTVSCSCN